MAILLFGRRRILAAHGCYELLFPESLPREARLQSRHKIRLRRRKTQSRQFRPPEPRYSCRRNEQRRPQLHLLNVLARGTSTRAATKAHKLFYNLEGSKGTSLRPQLFLPQEFHVRYAFLAPFLSERSGQQVT